MNEQSIGQWQQSVNEQTKDAWDLFASHRVQMTALIEQAVGVLPLSFGKPTLCVLGAGNGNDLDLAKIAPQFSEIRLVDLDPTALGRVKDRYADQPEVVENVQWCDPFMSERWPVSATWPIVTTSSFQLVC